MFSIVYEVDHTFCGELDITRLNHVCFNTLRDALVWAGFYHGLSDNPDGPYPPEDEYQRTYRVRGIYEGWNRRLDTCSDDYITTHLSRDEIASLVTHSRRWREVCSQFPPVWPTTTVVPNTDEIPF